MKSLMIGGLAALALGAGAGTMAQGMVKTVVSSDAGSRLEVASAAVPLISTPWAAGDASAPTIQPSSVPATWTAADERLFAAAWTAPPEPEPEPVAEPEAETPAVADEPVAEEPAMTEPSADGLLEPATEAESYAPAPADTGLIVASFAP